MEQKSVARILLTTVATLDDARVLGRLLVEEQLAACATFIPAVESIYHWKAAIEESREVLVLLKTIENKVEALEARLNEVHPYQTPEFLVFAIDSCGNKYLEWLRESLHP